jgi:hypothetical protein
MQEEVVVRQTQVLKVSEDWVAVEMVALGLYLQQEELQI